MLTIADVVDLGRYPVHELESAEGSALVESCREALRREGAVKLDGFLRAEATETLVAGARELATLGYANDEEHNAYFDDEIDESLPEDDPRRILVRSAQKAVAMDLLPPTFGARFVYESEVMASFVAAALEKDVLYASADPLDGCNMTVYEERDELGWHFDQSEFSVTLMIQRAERGGDFEYVPMIRSPEDERYDAVRAVLQGHGDGVVQLATEPGTLAFFRGRYSIHRVPPVEGSTPRMNSVLTYSTTPGHKLSPMAQQLYYGRTA
ncbi:MAG: 2OG-Fe(II) oxygenase [Actinobacteria bacterium]|nr:MAG: 2OG-Fe(II) oxygenase [Actinomycetota bacterium]